MVSQCAKEAGGDNPCHLPASLARGTRHMCFPLLCLCLSKCWFQIKRRATRQRISYLIPSEHLFVCLPFSCKLSGRGAERKKLLSFSLQLLEIDALPDAVRAPRRSLPLHRFGEVSQAQVFPYGIVAIKWLKVGSHPAVFNSSFEAHCSVRPSGHTAQTGLCYQPCSTHGSRCSRTALLTRLSCTAFCRVISLPSLCARLSPACPSSAPHARSAAGSPSS